MDEFGLRWLLRRMKVHPNAFYNYLLGTKADYYTNRAKILDEITNIYHEYDGILGHRAMKVFLSRKGIFLSKTTVHKYMNRSLGLRSICRRKKPPYKKGHPHKVFPNLLLQSFRAEKPNTIWCTDFTYLSLSNGSLRFNCTILDLYDRSVIASITDRHITSDLAIETLKKAIASQGHIPEGLILHSDQGRQYTSLEFIQYCQENGITQSMSKTGCPYDNAPMERYYNSLKEELINRYYFRTEDDLYRAISEYAYGWYNQVRPHAYNNYLTPYEVRYGS